MTWLSRSMHNSIWLNFFNKFYNSFTISEPHSPPMPIP